VGDVSGTVVNNGTLIFNRPDTFTFPAAISGNAFTTQGTGTVILTGASTYSGDTNITAGTIQAGVNNALPVGTNVTLSANTGLALGAYNLSIGDLTGPSTATLNLGSGSLTIGEQDTTAFAGPILGTSSSSITLTTGATGPTGSGGTLTFSNNVSAGTISVGPAVNDVETLNITAGNVNVTNLYVAWASNGGTATVAQSGGTVNVTGRLGIGDQSSILGNIFANYIISGGTLNVNGVVNMGTSQGIGQAQLTIGTGSTVNLLGNTSVVLGDYYGNPATIIQNGGTVAWANGSTGALQVDGGGTYLYQLNGGDLYLPKVVWGGQAASTSYSNANASFLFNGGTLHTTASGVFFPGSTGVNSSHWNTTIGSGGATIDTAGNNVTFINSLTTDSSTSNDGGLTKLGGGKLTLAGSNTYNGPTLISNGSLGVASIHALSPNSAFNITGGTLDAAGYNNTIASLTMASTAAINLGTGSILAVTGTATLAGTLDVVGTISSLPDTLLTYSSETGTFTTLSGIPSGDKLVYGPSSLQIVSSGPTSLTWTGAASSTWNTSDLNWNTSTATVAYSDNSNTSTGDIVTFNDTNGGHYAVTISGAVHPTSVTFNNSTGNYTLSGTNSSSGIAGTAAVTLIGTGTVTLSSNNTYTGGTFVNAGKLVLNSATAFPSNTALNISTGATVQVASHASGTSYVPTLSTLNNSGTIDLTNNAMVIKGANGSIGTLFSQVANGYHSGGWNGTNASAGVILSSTAAADTTHLTAVGIATGLTSFQGSTVNASDVLLKYTYYGDANLDGQVNSTDYGFIDNGFLTGATGWQNGDFNYDGTVNGSDYTLIDNAFNTQGAQLAAEVASPTAQLAGGVASAVPEPASLGLIGFAAMALLGRRNRRRN
jgi:autotransporter-associated beta strand protein